MKRTVASDSDYRLNAPGTAVRTEGCHDLHDYAVHDVLPGVVSCRQCGKAKSLDDIPGRLETCRVWFGHALGAGKATSGGSVAFCRICGHVSALTHTRAS